MCDFAYLRGKVDKSLLNDKCITFFPYRLECIPLDGKGNCDGNLGDPEILMQELDLRIAAHRKPELSSSSLLIKVLEEC